MHKVYYNAARLLACAALLCTSGRTFGQAADTLSHYTLEQVQVMAPVKTGARLRRQAVSYTAIGRNAIEQQRIIRLQDLSAAVPGLHIPDYGSRMTSSIYMRGMGTRIDNPVLGLYVDGVPVMNKNNFDFDFFDLSRIDILRGPQGTLFGRNTMGGVADIRTLSPLDYQGTRFGLDYGNGNTLAARVAYYMSLGQHAGLSVGGRFSHSNGFYTNSYNGRKCDNSDMSSLRARFDWRRRNTIITATLSGSSTAQGGFPYSRIENGTCLPVNYNDPCSYNRDNLLAGLNAEHRMQRIAIANTLSFQYTGDRMVLDQDFTPRSMFTLTQAQREAALTEEAVVRSTDGRIYQWLAGLFAFWKRTSTSAPVTFKQDGIRDLIEANINNGLHTVFPNDSIDIRQQSFTLFSDFVNPSAGAALFHTSTVRLGQVSICAGLRVDFEHSTLRYDSRSQLDYIFTATMQDYRPLSSSFKGSTSLSYIELLPRLSATYDLPQHRGNVFVSAAKGYKAGGFNIQMFSDILQNQLKEDMMNDLGVHMGGGQAAYSASDILSYKPEYCWTLEAGTHLDMSEGALQIDAAAYLTDCRDQQITVFPPGSTTGRMMRNAGRTRILGAEAQLRALPHRNVTLTASCGFTDARFTDYSDGHDTFDGNRVPYVPQNTLSLGARWRIEPGRAADAVILYTGFNGTGRIWWDDANTVSQPFFGLLSASVTIVRGSAEIELWGRNLTGCRYDTFWFRSMGNSFVQRGKPVTFGISLRMAVEVRHDKKNKNTYML